MHFSGDVSLGNLLTVVTLLGISVKFGWIVGGIQEVIAMHTKRLDRYEAALISVVADVQRMIGRIEGVQDRLDRKL